MFVSNIFANFPASCPTLEKYKDAQHKDELCSTIANFCKHGWPDKRPEHHDLKLFWEQRGKFSICNDMLCYGRQIVVPEILRPHTLKKIHDGHQGITCHLRAKLSVWWPKMSQDIQKLIQHCPFCAKNAPVHYEPLIPSSLPEYPWQKVGSDSFLWKNETYIIVVDYYSQFPEILRLPSTSSQGVIRAL